MHSTSSFYTLCISALNLLPDRVTRIPYELASKMAQNRLEKHGCEIGFRNSFVFGGLIPGLSDLDLTASFEACPTAKQIQELCSSFRSLRLFFPRFGEINLYSRRDREWIKRFGNPYELDRCPNLGRGEILDEATSSQKLVFVCRMLEADRNNLIDRFSWRKKKWSRHFKRLGFSFEKVNCLESLLNRLDNELFGQFDSIAIKKFLTNYLYENGAEPEQQIQSGKHLREFAILYPHRWIRVKPDFNADVAAVFSISGAKELIWEQLRWEIMGLFSQYRFLEIEWMEKHLEDLFLLALDSPQITEGLKALQQATHTYHAK